MSDLQFRLGLPDPASLQLADAGVVQLYREFVATLAETPDRSAIRCDSTFFDLGEHRHGQSTDDEIDPARLKLLAALLQPGPRLIAAVREKTFDVDRAATQRGQYSGHVYDSEIARAFKVFRSYPSSPDGQRFRREASDDDSLLSLQSMLSTAPGLDWFQEVDVRPFNPDWAVVLHYDDTEEAQHASVPKVLGFAARERLARSVAAILASEPHYWIHATEETIAAGCTGLEAFLLTFCWSRDDDCEYGGGGSGLGHYLLHLDETDISAFCSRYHRDSYAEIAEDVQRICSQYEESENDEDNDGESLGDPPSAETGVIERLARLVYAQEWR